MDRTWEVELNDDKSTAAKDAEGEDGPGVIGGVVDEDDEVDGDENMDDEPPVEDGHFFFPDDIKALDILLQDGVEPEEPKNDTLQPNFESIWVMIENNKVHLHIAEHKKNILPKLWAFNRMQDPIAFLSF